MRLSGWMGSGDSLVASAEDRAGDAWRRINDRPTEIIIRRGQGANQQTLAAQTVRLEADNGSRFDVGLNVRRSVNEVVVFGVRDHATEPDTDIKTSDRFRLNGVEYEVMSLMTPPGEVQAVCEEN